MLAALAGRAAVSRLGQSVPRVAAEQVRAEPPAAVSRHPQAVPQGCGDRGATPRRCFASRRTSSSARWCRRRDHSVDGHAIAVLPRRRRHRARRPVRHGARVHVARGDGRRHRVRHARRAPRDDGRLPRRACAADGDLRRLADLARPRRCRRSPSSSRRSRSRCIRASRSPRWRSRWCCSPRTRAFRSTIRRRISS